MAILIPRYIAIFFTQWVILRLTQISAKTSIKARVITWNVADNGRMGGSYTDEAIDNVLGLIDTKSGLPSVYAIGVEENCWMCNKKNWPKLGDRFLRRINIKAKDEYQVIGIQGTRNTDSCEIGCSVKSHGSVMLIVIAKKSFGMSHLSFRHNAGCSANLLPNKEKGVAGIKFMLQQDGKSLCFGAAHLDSAQPKYRRQCLQKFFETAEKEVNWSESCAYHFIFGDFNTRTGDKSKDKGTEYVPKNTNFDSLMEKDELVGDKAYGVDSEWETNLLSYINSVQFHSFKEKPVSFMPTYSIKPSKEFCDGKLPCYRKDRPKSWTDRIIYTNGKCDKYDAVYAEYGDHFPVFAEYSLPL